MVTSGYRAHGKLLLTGEYYVLSGATSLAITVKYSQSLNITEIKDKDTPEIQWNAKNNGSSWFNAVYRKEKLDIVDTSDYVKAERLKNYLRIARKLNADFLSSSASLKVETDTDFNVEWGLGTSSTLIVNLARWAQLDPFTLFFRVSDGSGYDIACAVANSPVLYRISKKKPVFEKVSFYPEFHKCIYFVYLARKQNTGQSVKGFLERNRDTKKLTGRIKMLTDKMFRAKTIDTFNNAIREHEQVISESVKINPVKVQYFSDFEGEIKSLGAWGGDFVMATWKGTRQEILSYFNNKGFETVIPFSEMIL